MSYQLDNADVREWSNEEKYHALLCDPPYELAFMGKKWDGTGVAFQPETWAHLAQFLLPGGFLMAFGGSRTAHRLACAIEDAGLIIHPMIGWVYAVGFPKATNLHSQHEKTLCEQVEVDGKMEWHYKDDGEKMRTKPPFRHEQANIWYPHRYGLQALKPALEPIVVAQKPYEGKPVDSITGTGAGAMWIDGGRIGNPPPRTIQGQSSQQGKIYGRDQRCLREFEPSPQGRWPANFALVHHPDCERIPVDGCIVDAWECVEGCPVLELGRQSGERSSGKMTAAHKRNSQSMYGQGNGQPTQHDTPGDTGTAARFFYQAKASRRERDEGLEERNPHPTLKPIGLTRWLATLLLPPEDYAPRRLLVPFAGSGSEMIGAHQAGWEDIVGIEQDEEYCKIAEARLEHWTSKPEQDKLI